tara:strand:- start:1437 stop:4253 length:2817 start_codon:yes stop_codon:yes gene_type:complete
MLLKTIKKIFDIREGEYKISFLMQAYIFLIITTLLIVKPTVNALFLSGLGVESLPFAFLIVALVAVFSSFFYYKALDKYPLNKIIEATLISSIVLLTGLGIILNFNIINIWLLYFFYVWVAIYAVLSASQFWVLANIVFNVREAKRIFGFIGSGAILGGIFGGYLTSLLVPWIGIENLMFIAALFLAICVPLLSKIWKLRVQNLNAFKQKKRTISNADKPFTLIKNSKHLTYIAGIVGISVIVAKLVDYLFSDFASASITDPDDLASFFAFWFSTFNLISLAIQLFVTRKIVGIWGVGFSLVLLPIGIFMGSLLFFIFPELAVVVLIKAIDGTMKQSIHKSAIELLSLPLPFDLKNKTKSYIDVVVDSIATGIAGFILIFIVKGLNLSSSYISAIIMVLVIVWVYFVYKVRLEYFKTFRENLSVISEKIEKNKKPIPSNTSVLKGMKTVFENGTESQILFMLKKLQEINDKRFVNDVQKLLQHPSDAIKTAAIQNMYFLNSTSLVTEVPELLKSDNEDLVLSTLEYLLLHESKDSSHVYNEYLNHANFKISNAALLCLAREAKDNQDLKQSFQLEDRISNKIDYVKNNPDDISTLKFLLRTIGNANFIKYHSFIQSYLNNKNQEVVTSAIYAAGLTMHTQFISPLLRFLPNKIYRESVKGALLNYGEQLLPILSSSIKDRSEPLAICRCIPMVFEVFNSQESIKYLIPLLGDRDLTIRLEVIRALSNLKRKSPRLIINQLKIVKIIFDECKLHQKTLSAMHTEIIQQYRNRRKTKVLVSDEEREARAALLDLLEHRLESGLERIFKLLGLKYQQKDIDIAYSGLMSEKHEAQANAIEFLDNLLTGDLKRTLIPIIENTVLDITSDEVIQKIQQKILTEFECFQLLLDANDLKIKLAVLYLIKIQNDSKYIPLVEKFITNEDEKLRGFALETLSVLQSN